MGFLKFLTSKAFIKNFSLSIVLTIVLIFVVFIWLKIFTHHGRSKPVPDFYGLTSFEVHELADQENFRIEIIDSVYNFNAERGTIVEQKPNFGKHVKKNRKIFLSINAVNPEMVSAPGVVGVTHRQAKALIEASGLKVGKLSYLPDLARNNVLKQKYQGKELNEGVSIPKGSVIDLVLGTGLSDRETIVPEMIGLSYESARNKILHASLNIGVALYDETVENIDDSLQAFIWKQNPEFDEDKLTPLGSPVYLWLTMDSTRLFRSDTLDVNIE
ncbi:MAG: penicillin-binding protein [Bacteroidetes bacterium]|nr:MAG: penicillin-binding protein [Bacteroidota bacterium]